MNTHLQDASAWEGVWTALITPLRLGLDLDEVSLANLIEEQIASGVRGLVVAGSTGEGSLLSPSIYEKLLFKAHDIVKHRIPLVAGLGIGGTEACLRNLELARRAKFNGVLASPPAYVKAPQRGLMVHFLKIAAEGLPVCLYEIPGRAASSLENTTLFEMVERGGAAAKNIVALKDATADLTRPLAIKHRLGSRLALLSGDDLTYAPYLAAGGNGVVSVASHLVPRSMKAILAWAKSGANERAANEQARLLPLVSELFRESNPIPVKSLLAHRHVIQDAVFCPPLCPMKPELLAHLEKLAAEIQDLSL